MLSLIAFAAPPAQAVELFGVTLLGEPKSATKGAVSYTVKVEVDGGDKVVRDAVSAASLLVTQADHGASDTASLVARARADVERLTAALYAEARYGAKIDISIAGRPLADIRFEDLEETPGAPLETRIGVVPGPVFHFGAVSISQTAPTQTHPATEPHVYKLATGAEARSSTIITAVERIVEAWRAAGYPFARVANRDISADHARSVVDVSIVVEPGAPAVYGWISVVGADGVSSQTIARQSALKPGQQFDPADLKTSRERLRKLESIESVRIIEGEGVDPNGGVPITLEVRERKPRFFGATASVSTLDGAEVSAFWGHRNLFGEGERLRIDGSVSRLGAGSLSGLQFDAGAVYSKPGVLDIDTDFFAEFRIDREAPDTYKSASVRLKTGFLRRFDEYVTGSIAIEARQAHIEDAFGTRDFTLISLPAELEYDTRDNKLDPSRGVHAQLRLTPIFDAASGNAFLASQARVATYRALDEDRRAILAGRVIVGSIAGASLIDVPATTRFFAGGGGSVRGYEYRSVGPAFGGIVTGGLGLAAASAELRLRVTETIGIVPFIDIASAYDDSFPTFSEKAYVGAGIGLRYYTALGPLRLDAALPVTGGDHSGFGIYVGLGQAF